mmetsp:Transcript_31089/g.99788  ORF Transcript_31089/g.99788 Transcript_31089/m.99788 type:complete len:132 (+) Transcript_31089:545-940(+)
MLIVDPMGRIEMTAQAEGKDGGRTKRLRRELGEMWKGPVERGDGERTTEMEKIGERKRRLETESMERSRSPMTGTLLLLKMEDTVKASASKGHQSITMTTTSPTSTTRDEISFKHNICTSMQSCLTESCYK